MKFSAETQEAPSGVSPLWKGLSGLIGFWALFGGCLLLAITGLEAYNAVVKLTTGAASASEHELVKYMVGIAIFTFLPYCQLHNGHIAVDIFTQRASEGAKLVMEALGALIGLAVVIVLIKQMSLGMQSYIDFREITPVLHIPIWTAFPFVLISLGLWLIACLMSLYKIWLSFKSLGGKVA